MKKHLVVCAVAAVFGPAQAATLFSNGPVVDASGLSILQSGVDSSLGATSNASFVLADNFTVTGGGWNVESLDFFGYQTGAVGFTFTGVTWSIRSGADVSTATTVASGTSAVTNGGQVGFRVTSTTLTNTQRAIFRISADIPDVALPAGSYFVTWGLAGSVASGPFVPPVLGSLGTGNALQAPTGGAFIALQDGLSLSSFDVPFTINGVAAAVPEPGTLALWLAGGAMAVGVARRRRAA
jgi:hypothetical protein